MAKNNFLSWDPTASNNTDIGGIGILGTNFVSNFDNAFRELMAQLRVGVDGKMVYTTKAANYTAVADDNNAFLRFSAAATLSLTAAATLAANWKVLVVANGGDVVIDPNASETIDGKTTLTVRDGSSVLVICDGTNFKTNLLADQRVAKGRLYGLTLSNNGSDATNDIDIAAGEAASDGTIPYLMTLASALTKRLDAAWAVGTNQGGLDTGAIANTTYHVWLIQRSDTGVVDALFSASATSPTMPANYDRKRRIGSIIRESAAIVAFSQEGNLFQRAVKTDRNSTSAIASGLFTLSVPTGITVIPLLAADMATGTVSTDAKFDIGSAWEGATSSTVIRVFTTSLANTASTSHALVPAVFKTNTSAQIYIAVVINSGSLSAFTLATIGWIDNRGTV